MCQCTLTAYPTNEIKFQIPSKLSVAAKHKRIGSLSSSHASKFMPATKQTKNEAKREMAIMLCS